MVYNLEVKQSFGSKEELANSLRSMAFAIETINNLSAYQDTNTTAVLSEYNEK